MASRTTTEPTIADLAEQAAAIEAQAAQIRAEQARRVQAEAARLAEHQASVDAELVATGYDRDRHEAAVTAAREAVSQAIADLPLTKALIGFYQAQALRREALDQYLGALERQGHNTATVSRPLTEPVDVLEQMTRLAEQAGTAARLQAEAEFHARRDTPKEN